MSVVGGIALTMLEMAAFDPNSKELLEKHGIQPDDYDLSSYGATIAERLSMRPKMQSLTKSLAESVQDHSGFLKDCAVHLKENHPELVFADR